MYLLYVHAVFLPGRSTTIVVLSVSTIDMGFNVV